MQPMVIQLSTAQKSVVDTLALDGADNQTIANRLGLSVETVKSHLKVAYAKVGFNQRAALALAIERGEIVVEEKVTPKPAPRQIYPDLSTLVTRSVSRALPLQAPRLALAAAARGEG